MATKLADFFATLGFKIDDEGLKTFNKSLGLVTKQAAVAAAAIGGMGAAFGAMMYKITSDLDKLDDFAKLNNVNVEQLQRLQYAADQMDSSAEAVKNSIAGLNSIIGQAATGVGRGALTMQKFGLSAKDANGQVKDSSVVLEEIRQKMLSMTTAERISMAERMGLDRTLIPMLTDTTGEFEKLIKEADGFIVSAEDTRAASELMDKGFTKITNQIKGMVLQVAVKFLPTMKKLTDSVLKFLADNKEAIQGGLTNVMSVIIKLVTVLGNTLTWFLTIGDKFIDKIGGISTVLKILGVGLGIFVGTELAMLVAALPAAITGFMAWAGAVLAATWPFILIGALIVAFVLLLQDAITWLNGGESALGSFYDKVELVIESVMETFKEFWEWITKTYDKVSNFMGKISGWFGGGDTNLTAKQEVINRAGHNVTANDNRKVDITISTPDPQAAGRAVSRELSKDNKSLIRNAQGGFAY